MTLSNDYKKHLRGIGHRLHPIVTVAGKGLSTGVKAEIERALDNHELIKVRLNVADRDTKKALCEKICTCTGAEPVQQIGHTLLLYRQAEKPDPKLSNLLR